MKLNSIKNPQADIGDYLKVMACTAVMLQSLLSWTLAARTDHDIQTGIGIVYELVKFTAPAFIFGILYTTTRQKITDPPMYRRYLKQACLTTFFPTFFWTIIYLTMMPWLQQVSAYHDIPSFLWQFINGNAAPHLWYNTMMIQFILLMPAFWKLGRWCGHDRDRGVVSVVATLLVQIIWILFYEYNVLVGPHSSDWYWCDRLFISFLCFGVLGMLTWQYHHWLLPSFEKSWWLWGILSFIDFFWNVKSLLSYGFPVDLNHSPYVSFSMIFYDLMVIFSIVSWAQKQLMRRSKLTLIVHCLAGLAYQAYLSHVFWAQCLWLAFGRKIITTHPVWGLFVIYVLTWFISFASAFISLKFEAWLKKSFAFKSVK